MLKKIFHALDGAITNNDEDMIQDIIFSLREVKDQSGFIPDEISFGIIEILRRNEMKASPLAGHLLNFFEFHSTAISPKAKDRCVGFLNAWGDKFTHVHSVQVVTELTYENYLK